MHISAHRKRLLLKIGNAPLLKGLALASLLALVVFECYLMQKHVWIGDFWTHVPPIIEFSKAPPYDNPWINGSQPDLYMTPYHWILGKVLAISGADVLNLMVVVGVANLVFLFVALYYFGRIVLKLKGWLAPLLLFLSLLLYWGYNPWSYSGFFALGNLNFILPYPSTFCMILILSGLTLQEWGVKKKKLFIAFVAVVQSGILWFMFLTHPLSFIFYNVGLAAWFLAEIYRKRYLDRNLIYTWVLPLFASGLFILLYPHFPVLEFFRSGGGNFHEANLDMYSDNLFLRLLPLFTGAILLFLLPGKQYIFLKSFFLLLCCIYLLGWITGQYSFGRSIALIYFCVQAAVVAFLKWQWIRTVNYRRSVSFLGLTGIVMILAVVGLQLYWSVQAAWYLALKEETRIDQIKQLSKYLNPDDDVVITNDTELAFLIPTLLTKGLIPLQPSIWIRDGAKRKSLVDSFFISPHPNQHLKPLRELGATHALIQTKDSNSPLLLSYPIVFSNQMYALVRIDSSLVFSPHTVQH